MGELNEWGKSIGYVIGEFISPGHAERERSRHSYSSDDDDDSPYDDRDAGRMSDDDD
jgi:hypothetical protein